VGFTQYGRGTGELPRGPGARLRPDAGESRGAESGRRLSTLLQNQGDINPDLAREWLRHLAFYDVFSPSDGAYKALVATGNLELIEPEGLQLELRDFFGSFEDVRASEWLLLDTQAAVLASGTFAELANWQRMGQAGIPVAGPMPVEQWPGSDEFTNAIGILTVRQDDVLEDYEYLRTRILNISAAIAHEISVE